MPGPILTERVIEAPGRPRLGSSLRELWRERGTVLAFATRSTQLKYRQSILGLGWALAQPLAFVAVFSLTLGRVADIPGTGVDYAAFALSVLVPWTFVNISVSLGAQSIVNDAGLIRKVYFPREATVVGAVLSAVVDLAAGLGLFVVLGPLLGAHVSFWWLLAPVLVLPLALLVSGITLFLAALNAYYRDVRYAVPILVQLWLYASPVAYPLGLIPHRWRGLYLVLNPLAGILDSFRRVLAVGTAPRPTTLLAGVAGSLVIAVLGYWSFKAMEPRIAEVV